ncbi:glycine betaine/L-proline transporter ProP [Leekyejoonella antrihumi]|uniref:Putative proline/betaine transporter n=1 Tax=Leekyejoonella antrihumi TaxID=1660198 RepID=A0A563E5J9_9MICO|nr:glycine betaine/L-proline transporter ProP [Leekyejoonella antrihumi]TWP37569.1 glycine betaine/L-proline transporter ProP [Leekyejoonella antrihumi]
MRFLRRQSFLKLKRRKPPLTEDNITVVDPATLKRAISASAVGNMMEWFDFGVYGYLAATLGKVFFPGASPAVQLLSTFATFAVAFLVRPLGGLFFGPLGDRVGRQKVLAATMIMMAIGTFAVGLIPSYSTIGIGAPILLLIARMVQGFSTGGEYGGATTFIAEYSPDRKRGFLGSFLDFGTFIGYALGSGLVTVLNGSLGDQTMLNWGWRIPFWVAGPIGLVGLYMRLKLEETPAFQEQLDAHDAKVKQQEQQSGAQEIKTVFVRYWRPLLVCIGLVLLYNVTNYMITAYLPSFFTETLGRGQASADMLVLSSMLVVVVIIVGIGRISDKVGRKPVFAFGAVAQIILAIPLFKMLEHGGTAAPLIACLAFGVILACFAAPTASTLPALFPTKVRYGALSIGFNISVSVFGGTTPLVTEGLVSLTDNNMMPAYYLVGSGIIGLVAVFFLRESATQPLAGSSPQVGSKQEAAALIETVDRLPEPSVA